MKLSKNKGYILSIIVIIIGVSVIFLNVRKENIKVATDRNNYHIVSDINKNDILKIEKRILDTTNIKQILITKSGSDNVYRIDDKNLISDIIASFVFEKFTYNPNSILESEDWFVEIGVGSNTMKLTFSNDSKIVKLNYNEKDFMLEVDEVFYDFMYKLFGSLES